MKMNGVKLECPNEEILVLPRPDGDLVFRAKAVLDCDEFDKICPEPKAPVRVVKGGKKEVMLNDPTYILNVAEHNARRMAWIVLKSLEATDGLEWETVKLDQPETWTNYSKELQESGFSAVEVNRIVTAVLRANALDEAKLESARMSFLAGQAKE